MASLENTYLFLFVFSILTILRVGFQFFILIKNDQPSRLNFKRGDLIFYGLSMSYIITYIIEKI